MLIVLGVVGLCVVCCCGGAGLLGFLGFKRGQRVDVAAKGFARRALLAGGKDWRFDSFRPYLSSTWKPSASDAATFSGYERKLGSIESLGAFTTTGFFYGSQNGQPSGARVSMTVPAKFAKADGTIEIRAVRIDRRWGIEHLKIDSPALLK